MTVHRRVRNPCVMPLPSQFRLIKLNWLCGANISLKLRKHRRMTR